eukprot:g171.t1
MTPKLCLLALCLPAAAEVLRDINGLQLSEGAIVPAFDPAVASYKATVGADTEAVTLRCPVADHATVTVAVDGAPLPAPLEEGAATPPIPLKPGADTVLTIVAGAFPVKKQYSLVVTRPGSAWEAQAKRELAALDASGAPQQIRLALGRTASEMRVTWTTAAEGSTVVRFGRSAAALDQSASGARATRYSSSCAGARTASYNYTSGYIHRAQLTALAPDTTYFYAVGKAGAATSSDTFSFRTLPDARAPADSTGAAAAATSTRAVQTTPPPFSRGAAPLYPFAFGAIGDLGQTDDSLKTVQHLAADPSLRALLHAGDMSYADCDHHRWDTWGHMAQPLSAKLGWMVCAGNHEVETDLVHGETFAAYKNRFSMPEAAPGKDSTTRAMLIDDCTPSVFVGSYDYGNAFYSFELGPATVVVLSTYTGTDAASPQYKWLKATLQAAAEPSVRASRPWIVAMMHGPWYNSNQHHHNENNTVAMRANMEPLFRQYDVNAVISGHVHAYERSEPVFNNQSAPALDAAPVYFNIGDGGNREGHNMEYEEQPEWSAYRNGSQFGHARLELLNDTHAQWQWMRNADTEFVVSDETMLLNRYALRARAAAERHHEM